MLEIHDNKSRNGPLSAPVQLSSVNPLQAVFRIRTPSGLHRCSLITMPVPVLLAYARLAMDGPLHRPSTTDRLDAQPCCLMVIVSALPDPPMPPKTWPLISAESHSNAQKMVPIRCSTLYTLPGCHVPETPHLSCTCVYMSMPAIMRSAEWAYTPTNQCRPKLKHRPLPQRHTAYSSGAERIYCDYTKVHHNYCPLYLGNLDTKGASFAYWLPRSIIAMYPVCPSENVAWTKHKYRILYIYLFLFPPIPHPATRG